MMIIESLLAQDVATIHAKLVGWARKGYEKFPIRWPPDRRLGGKRELKRVASSIDDEAVTLYVQIDPVHAIQGNGRFSARRDVEKKRTNHAGSTE